MTSSPTDFYYLKDTVEEIKRWYPWINFEETTDIDFGITELICLESMMVSPDKQCAVCPYNYVSEDEISTTYITMETGEERTIVSKVNLCRRLSVLGLK